MKRILIVGCGYVGRRVAAREQSAGNQVQALVRSDASRRELEAAGIAALQMDLDAPVAFAAMEPFDWVYYFAPPPPRGQADPRIENVLRALSKTHLPKRIVLISTTGVYGDCHGEWVDERRPPAPRADRARRRLAAERSLQRWCGQRHVEWSILRVPGIYGPGRLPEQRLGEGKPVLREQDAPYSNRVHADDLVRACMAAARHARDARIYNVTDGHPTTMTDYFNQVADALGLARPRQLSPDQAEKELSEGMLSYLAESKRLDNRRMREELGVEPQYSNLKDGLAASVNASSEPG